MQEVQVHKVKVDAERCKGCYYCVENCPSGAISISKETNAKSYNFVVVDQEKCTSCGSCYKVCPDCVFEIF